MSGDMINKFAQDKLVTAIKAFVDTFPATCPVGQPVELYTYDTVGQKEWKSGLRGYRLVTVTVTNGAFLEHVSIAKARVMIEVSSRTNMEKDESFSAPETVDAFGIAHAACFGAVSQFVYTTDFDWILDSDHVTTDQEEVSPSLVDSLSIDIYFNTELA